MFALICVLSYVCSPPCSHLCAPLVLSYVCSPLFSHLCALLCVLWCVITTTSLVSFRPPDCLGYSLSPEAGQQVKGTKQLFLRRKVFFSIFRFGSREVSESLQSAMAMQSCQRCHHPSARSAKTVQSQILKKLSRDPGLCKKLFCNWKVFPFGLDPGRKAHKLISSFELTR